MIQLMLPVDSNARQNVRSEHFLEVPMYLVVIYMCGCI